MTRKASPKTEQIKNRDDLRNLVKELHTQIGAAQTRLTRWMQRNEPLESFASIKFDKAIKNPHSDEHSDVSFLEFINQIWTTLASYRAVDFFLNGEGEKELKNRVYVLNLGTQAGHDITSVRGKESFLDAEVFASTSHSHNSKLRNDLLKLRDQSEAPFRYVFAVVPTHMVKKARDYEPKDFSLSKTGLKIQVFSVTETIAWFNQLKK
jgi:hypothetical protein